MFLQVLNMSFSAGVVILFVLAARLLLKKTPKIFSYLLWMPVLFRLLCPWSFESALSLFPLNPRPVRQDIIYQAAPRVDFGFSALDGAVNPLLPAPKSPAESVNPLQIWISVGEALWIAGMGLMLLMSVLPVLRLYRRIRCAVREEGNIYRVAGLDTPFVMGVFKPRIYLPAALCGEERRYILLHEQIHIKRLDHLIKLAAFLALCIHWFNPLVWVAYLLYDRDMEMSCDEKVLKCLGAGVKKEYSASLLSLAAGRRFRPGAPLHFGGGNVKSRIKNVLGYRRPAFWAALAGTLTVAAVCLGLAVNPTPDFDLPKALARAESFKTQETDPLIIGQRGLEHYYGSFMGEDVPAKYRITRFELRDSLTLLAGDESEFCAQGRILLDAGDYFLTEEELAASGNRPAGENTEVYRQIRIKSLGGGSYRIVNLGAGEYSGGLKTVKEETAASEDGEAEFIAALLKSRSFADGALAFTVPSKIPDRYRLRIEVSALIPAGPGVTDSIEAFGSRSGDPRWEAGKTYREALFSGEIPDGTELFFDVYFTAPMPDNPAVGKIMSRGSSKWVFEGGQPQEAARPSDTAVSVENGPGESVVTYTEAGGSRFSLRLKLPDGWTLKADSAGARAVGAYVNGECVAGISYDIFDDTSGLSPSDDGFYRAVFGKLMMGSTVSWDNGYTPLKQTELAGVAVCRILRKDMDPKWEGRMAEAPEIDTPGILAYDGVIKRTAAIAFMDNRLSEKEILEIAESIAFTK